MTAPGTLASNTFGTDSYLLISLCPVDQGSYSLSTDLRWLEWVPDPEPLAGIAFGHATDRRYIVDKASAVSGHKVMNHPDGELSVYSLGQAD